MQKGSGVCKHRGVWKPLPKVVILLALPLVSCSSQRRPSDNIPWSIHKMISQDTRVSPRLIDLCCCNDPWLYTSRQPALFPAKCIHASASGNWDLNPQPLVPQMQVFMQRVKRAAVVTQKYCYSWGCLPCWGEEQQRVLTLAKVTDFPGKSASGEMPWFP